MQHEKELLSPQKINNPKYEAQSEKKKAQLANVLIRYVARTSRQRKNNLQNMSVYLIVKVTIL